VTGEPRKIVDLSMPISERVPVYPGDPEPALERAVEINGAPFNVMRLDIGSHIATHCDAPYHYFPDGARIDELPLERFVGRPVIVDVRGHGPRQPVTWRDLEPYASELERNRMLLISTGWTSKREEPGWLDDGLWMEHPYLQADACARAVDLGIRTIGIDAMNPDETRLYEKAGREGFPVHDIVLGANGVIVENLVDLDRIDFADPLVCLFPLRVADGDGAPTRAVALQLS
jgi:kynurenine formamidase